MFLNCFARNFHPRPLAGPVAPGFSMALDVKRLLYDKQTDFSVGTEYSFIPGFALRTGYMMNNAAFDTKNKGFSVGAGVNLLNTQFDYSVTPLRRPGRRAEDNS